MCLFLRISHFNFFRTYSFLAFNEIPSCTKRFLIYLTVTGGNCLVLLIFFAKSFYSSPLMLWRDPFEQTCITPAIKFLLRLFENGQPLLLLNPNTSYPDSMHSLLNPLLENYKPEHPHKDPLGQSSSLATAVLKKILVKQTHQFHS